MLLPDGNPRLVITLDDNPRYTISDLKSSHNPNRLPPYWITGLLSKPIIYASEKNASTISIQFETYGLAHLLKIPASEISNQLLDPQMILDLGIPELREKLIHETSFESKMALLDTFFLEKLSEIKFSSSIKETLLNFDSYNHISLKSLSVKHNYSQKHILSEFKKSIGVTPKKLQTVNRINQAIKLLSMPNPLSFVQVAYSCGFYDQTHFIKKFKEITSMTPGSYMKKDRSYPHVINLE
jgi:AraC-like DNA-binding protein